MKDSGQAIIKLVSIQDGAKHEQTLRGDWFRKERSFYLRYEEEGGTRTLLRYSVEELSVVRRGSVQSEQLFARGGRKRGSYRSAAARFELETETTLLTASGPDGAIAGLPEKLPVTLEWKYRLYVEDQLSGRFHIRLHIQEEQQQ